MGGDNGGKHLEFRSVTPLVQAYRAQSPLLNFLHLVSLRTLSYPREDSKRVWGWVRSTFSRVPSRLEARSCRTGSAGRTWESTLSKRWYTKPGPEISSSIQPRGPLQEFEGVDSTSYINGHWTRWKKALYDWITVAPLMEWPGQPMRDPMIQP